MLPAMKVGEQLQNESIVATEKYSRAAARYTEASLVKKLGVGNWPSVDLCTDHFYNHQQKLCRERQSRRSGKKLYAAHFAIG
jgi:hypothetical protein